MKEMYNINDIYIKFRQAQSRALSRPYRIPKDISNHIKKMPEKHYKNLESLTKHFQMAYHNVEPDKYFDCGFQLYSRKFTYNKFFDDKIMKLYITKDKNAKRDVELSKKDIIESLKFVVKFIGDRRNKNISLLMQYCTMYVDNTLAPIKHYNQLKINKYFFVWLLRDNFLKLEDDIMIDVPIIVDNYRNLCYDLATIDGFLIDVKKKIQEM